MNFQLMELEIYQGHKCAVEKPDSTQDMFHLLCTILWKRLKSQHVTS